MPRWNIVTIIAGVDFSLCRATIVDGPRFATDYRGSTARSATGKVHVQRVNVGPIAKFGVHMDNANASDITELESAIRDSEAAGTAFRVQLQNALRTLDLWAIVDYDVDTWLTHGDESEGQIPDVTLRFESVGPYVAP
jgi:hypothetical protein